MVDASYRDVVPTTYYDVLLLGRRGSGKSTTGNKLLGLSESSSEQCAHGIEQFESKTKGLLRRTDKKRFVQPEDTPDAACLSGTTQCEVLACKIQIGRDVRLRILDVPGFGDPGKLAVGVDNYEGNLEVVRLIIRIQTELGLKFRRIVYFLPCRGPLEKADSAVQEEVKAMYHYFGKSIFESMVLAGTNPSPTRFQQEGMRFDREDIAKTQSVFQIAMRMATGDKTLCCPPIVFIGLFDPGSKIFTDIRLAPVQYDCKGLQVAIQDDIDVCAKCSVKIQYITISGKDKEERVVEVNEKGETEPYNISKCHFDFEAKYSTVTKFFGGIAHVLTLGLPYVLGGFVGMELWPGFTNSDECCVICKQSPGTPGCRTVGQKVTIDNVNGKVHHTKTLSGSAIFKLCV